jgi:sodium-dependent dicarboxylate transporter 2/3/5
VVPIGVTSIAIGVVQSLWLIRDSQKAFTDFLDPSVWFIFGSIVIGMTFSKTGLTQRIAYRMLSLIGENTRTIYLGAFVMTASLTLIMAHTAVAAAVFPLLMTIHALYDDSGRPTRFGKGLFIGMAYVAGAGSIITLLGAARGAVAIGFFREIAGRNISFFELSEYMILPGAIMVLLLWVYMMLVFRPEKKSIPGLRQRAQRLYEGLGPMKPSEIGTLLIVFAVILVLSLRSFIPLLEPLHKSAVILTTTLLFFLFRILDIKDLETVPWNIILLFGGAMSIGFCLWQTGAAEWLAINWLTYLKEAPWLLFVLGITFFVLIMTNFIMNVAAIAISLPVALTMAPYLGVAPEVILFSSLVAAGMPFLLLVGAAPNAIAYESKQFRPGEFFLAGIPASLLLMALVAIFVKWIWPMMGMPVLLGS